MMLWKCCTQYASKFGKLSSGHGTGEDQVSFQSLGKAMPKKHQTTAQLHSSHTLAKWCSKFSKQDFNSTWTENLQLFKLDLERQRNQGSNCQHRWIIKKAREFQKNIYFCFIDYARAFDCASQQTVENSSRDRNARPPYLPPEKSVFRSRSNI